ncbi:MAG: phosphoenolpyruvate--protein phosphotransferase [Oscillospiraceae bacterium]|nr:phosphoenolpyruvate--protein phosphotransferase [Oscillospiraceae bacterium]
MNDIFRKEGDLMKDTGVSVNRGMTLAPAKVVPPWPVFSDEKREFHTPKERQFASVQNAVASLSAFYTESANTFYAIGDNTRGDIMMVHNAMLHDASLQEEIHQQILENYALESAVLRAFRKYSAALSEIDNEYLAQRAADLDDVAARLICTILGREFPDIQLDDHPTVVIAGDVPPSVMAGLRTAQVAGIVLTSGGKTCHSAIIAAGLGVPVVAGCESAQKLVKDGEPVFLDANSGELHWELTDEQVSSFTLMAQRNDRHLQALTALVGQDTVTADGTAVSLYANGQDTFSCEEIEKSGSDGIGLFRTEFLFLNRRVPPNEEEQFFLYKSVIQSMNGKEVTFRTLDMGGDKIIPCFPTEEEANPFLGYRAIRMYLDRKDVFTPQIRAILRASAFGKARIMFPMISNAEEFLSAKGHILSIQKELREQGIAFDENIPIGTMIEVPSAAVNADILADLADFVSIGTNDLTQYTLAVDRMNMAVSYLYNHFDPAVLRLIRYTLRSADQLGKPCSVCGEMAADPLAIPLLLGMGLRKLSVGANALLRTRKLISLCDIPSCEALARDISKATTAKEVVSAIQKWIPESYTEWII